MRLVTHCAGGFLGFRWAGVTRLNCVCDFLHIERVSLMCFSFLVLWDRAFIVLAGNLTARVSNLRFSLNWLV